MQLMSSSDFKWKSNVVPKQNVAHVVVNRHDPGTIVPISYKKVQGNLFLKTVSCS